MNYDIEIKGFDKLFKKLDNAVKEDVIRKGLSQASFFMARWSRDNRFLNINPNRKQVHPTKLTARSSGGYRDRIFGQPPSEVQKISNGFQARFGTNINNKGFSYPRLHEFGGKFHPVREVLTPAIANKANQTAVVNMMVKGISEALEK